MSCEGLSSESPQACAVIIGDVSFIIYGHIIEDGTKECLIG